MLKRAIGIQAEQSKSSVRDDWVYCHTQTAWMLKALIHLFIYSVLQHVRGNPVANQMTRVTSSTAKQAQHSARLRSRDNQPGEEKQILLEKKYYIFLFFTQTKIPITISKEKI